MRITAPAARRVLAAAVVTALTVPAASAPVQADPTGPPVAVPSIADLLATRPSGQATAIAAINGKKVWAIGSSRFAGVAETMTAKWNGKRWKVVPSPNPDVNDGSFLNGATAVAKNDVWAVGYTNAPTETTTLVEHWNGRRWKIIRSPNVKDRTNSNLQGVDAAAPDDVWAVGTSVDGTGTYHPLALHWNGRKWKRVAMPEPAGSLGTVPAAVTALAADDAWATGTYQDASGQARTLVMHWDGTAWSVVPSPDPAGSP